MPFGPRFVVDLPILAKKIPLDAPSSLPGRTRLARQSRLTSANQATEPRGGYHHRDHRCIASGIGDEWQRHFTETGLALRTRRPEPAGNPPPRVRPPTRTPDSPQVDGPRLLGDHRARVDDQLRPPIVSLLSVTRIRLESQLIHSILSTGTRNHLA
jgi:hypothetical protein